MTSGDGYVAGSDCGGTAAGSRDAVPRMIVI